MQQQVKIINRWKLGILTSLGIFLFVTFACTQEKSLSKLTDETQIQRDFFTIVEDQPSGLHFHDYPSLFIHFAKPPQGFE